MLLIAHRGASMYYKENTITAFEKALEMSVYAIELDVNLSQDGHIMVIHDKTVNRITNYMHIGNVSDYTKQQLKAMEIPTLLEVIELVKNRTKIIIEIKDNRCIPVLLEILPDLNKQNIFISSFDHNIFKIFKQQFPDVKLIANIIGVPINYPFALENLIDYVAIDKDFIDIDFIYKCKNSSISVFVYVINDLTDLNNVIHVDFIDGIMSDCPDFLSKTLYTNNKEFY